MELVDDLSSPEKLLCDRCTALKVPVYGVFELTPVCNMDCQMCYVRMSRSAMEAKGGLVSVDKWLSLAKEMFDEGGIFVLLTGGEPLLYPHFKELYLGLKELGMIVTINTNGTLIDESWADFFAENVPRRINVTLYGSNGDVYRDLCHYEAGYEKAINGIKLLKERNISVKINGSLTNYNYADRFKLVELADGLDTYLKIDTYMYPSDKVLQHDNKFMTRLDSLKAAKAQVEILKATSSESEFINYIKEFLARIGQPEDVSSTMRCRAGKSSFVINWQGMLKSCLLMDMPIVNVFEKGFHSAWNELVDLSAKIRLSSKCASCLYRNVCQVCAASALNETGAFDGVPEYLCSYTKETVRLLKKELQEYEGSI